ncbi:hypothetical protein NHP190009_07510 [Helicobacter ailurogastricus]|nr:hypothetical protein NHP190009_07510 [Helicobacter ailurogastricus]
MMGFSMCCEDDLYEAFLKFKKGKPIEIEDKPLVERMLHYYKPEILPTKEQLKILEVWDPELRANIIKSGHVYPQKEALAHTKYKIVLSSYKNDFPFVNVNSDVIENNFSATFFHREKRDKAKQHIKALLEHCKYCVIHDNYILDHQSTFKAFARELLPKRRLKIILSCDKNSRGQSLITDLKQICGDWTITKNTTQYQRTHDRYILVEDTIEIILTSGIDYLYDESKDFSYLVREKPKDLRL